MQPIGKSHFQKKKVFYSRVKAACIAVPVLVVLLALVASFFPGFQNVISQKYGLKEDRAALREAGLGFPVETISITPEACGKEVAIDLLSSLQKIFTEGDTKIGMIVITSPCGVGKTLVMPAVFTGATSQVNLFPVSVPIKHETPIACTFDIRDGRHTFYKCVGGTESQGKFSISGN